MRRAALLAVRTWSITSASGFFERNEHLLAAMRHHDERGRFFHVLCALKAKSE